MASQRRKIVGLGEVLWDLLPTGKQLGGAPANFAYISTLLGNEGIVASRVGIDALGDEALSRLQPLGVTTDSIQRDREHPTGSVRVELDAAGQPKFEFASAVAWDFLEMTPQWQRLATETDAACFGSLAQRSPASRATIRRFLEATRPGALRIFDVNLRQSFYSREVLVESIARAEIVKVNHEELPRITELFGSQYRDEIGAARELLSHRNVKLVCVTRGCRGSVLVSADAVHEHSGFCVKVADTIGAGDAFTAGLTYEYLRGASLEQMNETANRTGAWVASRVGAMPSPERGGIFSELARVEQCANQ